MKKVLGKKSNYHNQTNDGSYELLKDYQAKSRAVACGPNAFAGALEIGGWPNLSAPGEQWPDSIMMIMHNTNNVNKFKKRRDIDLDKYPPNEIPQLYDVVADILYKDKGKEIRFKWGITLGTVIENINNNICMVVCGKFPAGGHYVLVTGYDDIKQTIIYNDSYPNQWPDKKGYNREMDLKWFEKNINKWRIDVPKYRA